jgi:hypothetical protein
VQFRREAGFPPFESRGRSIEDRAIDSSSRTFTRRHLVFQARAGAIAGALVLLGGLIDPA